MESAVTVDVIRTPDIDLIEINEAFASVVLAWEREHHPDVPRVNPQRWGDRTGPPARLLRCPRAGDARERARAHRGGYGLQTMCERGGMANATIIERLG